MKSYIAFLLTVPVVACAFTGTNNVAHFRRSMHVYSTTENEDKTTSTTALDPEVASKFTVMVCGSTSCAKQRRIMRVDEYATYGGMCSRKGDSEVQVGTSFRLFLFTIVFLLLIFSKIK